MDVPTPVPPPTSTPILPTPTPVLATLRGVVTDTDTGAPIAGASVTLNQQGLTSRTASTGTDGRFEFAQARVDLPSSLDTDAADYAADPGSHKTFQLAPAEDAFHPLTLTLLPGALEGRSLDSLTHAPLPSASYVVKNASGATVASGATDSNAHYSVGPLPPGRYTVEFSKTSYAGSSNEGTVRRNATTTLDGQLTPQRGRIRGTVIENLTGAPVPGSVVNLTNGGETRTTTADGSGKYVFENVAPGVASTVGAASTDYVTTANSGTGFTLPPGGEAEHVLILTARPGALRGTIYDVSTDLPLAGAVVQMTDSFGSPVASFMTDAAGTYEVTPLTAGRYSVTATKPGYRGAGAQGTVRANQTAVVDLDLAPLGQSISGLVLDQFTRRPISGAVVPLYNGAPDPIDEATTGVDGQFAFINLQPGPYRLESSAEEYAEIPQSQASVTLPAGAAVAQNLLLKPPAVSFTAGLTGVVTDQSTGKPIPGAAVQVFDSTSALAGTMTADENGRYLFTPFPAGQYTVTGWAFGYPDVVNSSVVVPPATLVVRDLVLVPAAGSLTGIVLDQFTGLPVPGALVEVGWPAGEPRTAITSSSGGFAYTQAPAGSYAFRASAQGYVSGDAATARTALALNGTAHVAMQLTPLPGGIFGVVTDFGTGLPLPGATVQLLSPTGIVLLTLTADEHGAYDTGELPPFTKYNLRFSAPGYTPRTESATTTAGRKNEVIAALVNGSGAISGIVVDRDTNLPIPEAAVTLLGPTGRIVATIVADGNGGFAFVPPNPGPYVVQVDPPASGPSANGYFTIPASSRPVVALPDGEAWVVLQLAQQPAALRGIVVEATTGEPLPGATVSISGPDGRVITLTSAADGTWEVSPIPAGAYIGGASLEGYWPSNGKVTIPAGQTGYLRLGLANNRHHIGGRVIDVTGRPIGEATITLLCPDTSGVSAAGGQMITVGTSRSDAGGTFALPTVAAGTRGTSTSGCTILAIHPDYFAMLPVPVGIPTADASVPAVTLVLAGRPATLRITTVDDRTGRIIPDVSVAVTHLATNTRIREIVTDASGFVVVDDLNPDDYHVLAEKSGYAPKEVEIYAGPNRTVEMRLRLSLALTGVVTDVRSGEIIPYARVTLFRVGDPGAPGNGRSRRANSAQTLFSGLDLGPRVAGASAQQGDTRFVLRAGAPDSQGRGQVVGTAVADAQGRFWFDLQDEGDYRAIAEAPGWMTVEESDDSGNVTTEGPVLVIPLKLTRTVNVLASASVARLPNTGGGYLAQQRR